MIKFGSLYFLKDQALKAYQSYEKRVKAGGYYEKERLSLPTKNLLKMMSNRLYLIKNTKNYSYLNYLWRQ